MQGRSPNVAFLPVVSLPELETWIETWAFSETIHSRSYTHIMRNVVNNPAEIFDDIVKMKTSPNARYRLLQYYDSFIELNSLYQQLGAGTHTINGKIIDISLHGIKTPFLFNYGVRQRLGSHPFYVSFACSFAFTERAKMEGNAKVIKLIARDEALHLTGTQHILQLMAQGKDDPDMAAIAKECRSDVIAILLKPHSRKRMGRILI